MRYNVKCPHCEAALSLPDYALWPGSENGYAEYPNPSEPDECLHCHQWLRVVLDARGEATAEKSERRWLNVFSDGPDWQDAGRIELRDLHGTTCHARLVAVDEHWTGSDEVPVWELTLSDGRKVSLYDFEYWRQASADRTGSAT